LENVKKERGNREGGRKVARIILDGGSLGRGKIQTPLGVGRGIREKKKLQNKAEYIGEGK